MISTVWKEERERALCANEEFVLFTLLHPGTIHSYLDATMLLGVASVFCAGASKFFVPVALLL